jgi:predicted nucleic acid-binding protein
MGKERLVLCDTNILVNTLRGNEATRTNLEKIGSKNIVFSIITHAEIFYGTKKRDFEETKKLLAQFKTYHITEETSKIFNGIILNYAISHRIQVPDGLIAAIAIANNLPLYTENTKHFSFIPEIKLYKP